MEGGEEGGWKVRVRGGGGGVKGVGVDREKLRGGGEE